jgi:hypothetical protein
MRRPDEFNERRAQGWPEHSRLPVHPAFRVESCSYVRWAEPAVPALMREISDHNIRFPKPHVAVLDRRYKGVRIQRTILRGFVYPEFVSCIDPFIFKAELPATPEHFLDVD